ncbi:outer membrane beta-barrel protein [Pontibacter populi]|uniref:Outer membrane beta-barrel protein n=1 Tax=Pontibacter populi TaxID=890055 RepID=A0ABV1RP14_9BACT
MDLRIKYIPGIAALCLCLLSLSQKASAQFIHKWQADVTIGTAHPTGDEYFVKEGYPFLSLAGNMKAGIRTEAQLIRNLNQWLAVGSGVSVTTYKTIQIPNQRESVNFKLNASTLNAVARIYPSGRIHRFTPFLQANVTYGRVSIAHDSFTYTVDSLSSNPGNPDHPALLNIMFTRPQASQQSNILGFGATAGAEMLLSDAVGVSLQAGYHRHRTEQMLLLQEDLASWDVKLGMFVRLFKTKTYY